MDSPDLREFFLRNAEAPEHIMIIHQDVRHYFDELSAKIFVPSSLFRSAFLDNVNDFADFPDHPQEMIRSG